MAQEYRPYGNDAEVQTMRNYEMQNQIADQQARMQEQQVEMERQQKQFEQNSQNYGLTNPACCLSHSDYGNR